MNNNPGTDNSNSESNQDQGNTGSSFFEGIGNAISGIFGKSGNEDKSTDVAAEVVTQAPNAPDMNRGMSGDSGGVAGPPAPVVLGSTDTSDRADTSMGADASSNPTAYQEEEPFVGSGGVGSAEFYENLRKGHEEAGGEYSSDLGDPNRQ